MNIFLIRHGRTLGNIKKLYMGRTDQGISDEGRAEIESFVADGLYPEVEKIFSSPLLRCRQTAEIIYPQHKPIIVENLQEMNFGQFEGLAYDEVAKQLDVNGQAFGALDFVFPDGESMSVFSKRCSDAFSELELLENTAVFTHGGVIMSLMAQLFNKPYYDFYVENGRGYVLSGEVGNLSYKPL